MGTAIVYIIISVKNALHLIIARLEQPVSYAMADITRTGMEIVRNVQLDITVHWGNQTGQIYIIIAPQDIIVQGTVVLNVKKILFVPGEK